MTVSDRGPATVPASYVASALDLLDKRGFETDALLRSANLSRKALEAPNAAIGVAEVARLIAMSATLMADESIAFELGRATKPTSHGTLGYALLTSSSLREAIELGQRFMRLRFRVFKLRLSVEADTAVLTFEEAISLGAQRPIVIAWFAGAIYRIGEFLLEDRFDQNEVQVRLQVPRSPTFERIAGHLPRIEFDQPENQARFPARWLEAALPLSDSHASRVALTQLERELALFGEEVDVVASVRALLADLSFGFGDLQAAAKRLHVSTRTLRRHLQQHGTSYQILLTEARTEHATTRLSSSALPLDEIAFELGYSDQANFTRAFLKWTGTTPGAFRKSRGTGG